MKVFDAWIFSARRAWARPLIRWTTVASLVIIGAVSTVFLWQVIPARRQIGTFILHYNIYLGIDQVRPWSWVFLFPGVWIALALLDLLLAFGVYHHDPPFATSLVLLLLFISLPCSVGLYYLARINL